MQQSGQIEAHPRIVRITRNALAQRGDCPGHVSAAGLLLRLPTQRVSGRPGDHARLQFLLQAFRQRSQHRLGFRGFILFTQNVIEILPGGAILRLIVKQRPQRLFGLGQIFVVPQNVGAEQFRRRALGPALLRQRRGERQRLANIALLPGLLRLRELAVKQRIRRLLAPGFRTLAAEIRRPAQILRGRLKIAAALGDIAHPGKRVSVLRIGLQDLFKLLLRRGGIAAVQVRVALTARLAAAPFTEVVLHFAILRVALHPGIVKRFIPRLRPHPQQRLAQPGIGLFAAAGHRLQHSDPFPPGLFAPGQRLTQGYARPVLLRMLSDILTQFAHRLRIERLVAGHRHVVFRRQTGRRNVTVKHTPPGRQRGGHVAAARLLSCQV